ncbi:MAG: D-aminoacyl-tRNA deacylase [Candidatus Bipolaricaulota bacterium]
MRVVLQRVSQASVSIDNMPPITIGQGFLLLIGIGRNDCDAGFPRLARKIVGLRIFEDSQGKMNLSLRDVGGEILAVSQFTLYGDTQKGRRPSFSTAAQSTEARALFSAFVSALVAERIPVKTGQFGARMSVGLVNEGPVTLLLETP